MNRWLAASVVLAVGVFVVNQHQRCVQLLDSVVEKAFVEEQPRRNDSMASLFKSIAQNLVLRAPSGPVSQGLFLNGAH